MVHLENASTVHAWMLTLAFIIMILTGVGAFCHQKRVATPHRERLEEGIEDLREVLIDRGYIQGRKKHRCMTKKQRMS